MPRSSTTLACSMLAVTHGGRLATFGRRLVADAVRGGRAALHLIDS